MTAPRQNHLAHDLRNIVGLVRALATELGTLVPASADDARVVAADLAVYSAYAMDALRIVEKWEEPAPIDVHLGAWGWALRLTERELRVGDVARAGRATLVVPAALEAGRALVAAMAGGRTVQVDLAPDGALLFETAAGARDEAALVAALEALGKTGLRATVRNARPCRVAVTAG